MLFFIFVDEVMLTIKKLLSSQLFLLANDDGMHIIDYLDSNKKDVNSFNIVSSMHKANLLFKEA